MRVCIVWVAVRVQGEIQLGVIQAQRPAAKARCSELCCDAMQRKHIRLHLLSMHFSLRCPAGM